MKKGIDLWKKIAYGEGAKKTNNSAFSATHTYIKLTLSFFYFFFMHLPLSPDNGETHDNDVDDYESDGGGDEDYKVK